MPKHGSINLYIHGNQKAREDGQPRMFTSTLTQLLNWMGGGGWGGGGGGGGGGRRRSYTYCYTVTNRMTPVLKWAVVRAILMFHNCEG